MTIKKCDACGKVLDGHLFVEQGHTVRLDNFHSDLCAVCFKKLDQILEGCGWADSLVPEEQAPADARAAEPPIAICSDPECAHPMAAHSKSRGCMVSNGDGLHCACCACEAEGSYLDYDAQRALSLSGPGARLKPDPKNAR